MGVNGVLPKILPWAGRKIQLKDFQNGIVITSCQTYQRPLPEQTSTVLAALASSSSSIQHHDDDHHKHKKRKRLVESQKKRKLRIGIDVGGWVAKACHGYGTALLDERHLSNYGRATLWEASTAKNGTQQEDQQYQRDSHGVVGSTLDNIENQQEQQKQQQHGGIMRDVTMEQEFVSLCSTMVMKKIKMLQEKARAEILVVFDGATPPLKQSENQARKQRREEAAHERDAPQVQEQHEKKFKAAKKAGASWQEDPHLQSAIISSLLTTFRTEKIPFLVAPYEADGQLAFLAHQGYFDVVVTEDSDLIGHGTASILYKINEETGEGILLQRNDLGATPPTFSLLDFSDAMLACMFVLAGCDYCNSLKGIGIVKARRIVKQAFHINESHEGKPHTPELAKARTKPALRKVLDLAYESAYQNNLTVEEKEEYEKKFLAALLMFRHPVVFDPVLGKNTYVGGNPIGQCDEELMDYEPYALLVANAEKKEEILGTLFPPSLQILLAEGWINPKTNQPYPNMTLPLEVSEEWKRISGTNAAGETASHDTSETSDNVINDEAPESKEQGNHKDDQNEERDTDEDDKDEEPSTQEDLVMMEIMPATQDINTEAQNTFDSDLESHATAKTAKDFDSKEKKRAEVGQQCLSLGSDISDIDTNHDNEDNPDTQEI